MARESAGRETAGGDQAAPTPTAASSTQSFYGRWAKVYDVIAKWTPGIRRIRRRVAAACLLESGDTVVELGCGTGANLPYLRKQVGPEGTVIGIDFTRPVLERARAATANYDNVHALQGDATQPPLESTLAR